MTTSILIVDNDDLTRDIIFRLITHRIPNSIIHATASFESALDLCSKLKVDIVITTTSMQPTSSNDMLDTIRKIGHNPIKIIIMTRSGQKNELDRLSTIANTYIIGKPINVDELTTLVNDKIAEVEMGRSGKSSST